MGRELIAGKPVTATEKRSAVPANVDAALRRALEKVPADRFATAAELAAALGNPAFRYGSGVAQGADPTSLRRWKVTAVAAGVVAVAALTAGRAGLLTPSAPAPQVVRQGIHLSSLGPDAVSSMAIGPDGGLAYADADGTGANQLFYKAPDVAQGTPIPGTDHPVSVSFSPTGDSIAFTQGSVGGPSKLIVVPLGGGVANTIATDADIGGAGGGLDWLDDGTILYETEGGTASPSGATISRVPADGSHPSEIVVKGQFDEASWVQGNPADGKALVIYQDTLWVADLKTGDVSPQMGSVARAWYFDSSHVIYVLKDGGVFATGFDHKTGALAPGGVRLFQGVRSKPDGQPDMALGKDGMLIFGSGGIHASSWSLAWLDRKGVLVRPLDSLSFSAEDVDILTLSPDDRRAALDVVDGGNSDIMVANLPSGPVTRLTPGGGNFANPIWTRDGQSLLFTSRQGDTTRILRMRADGSTPRMDTLLSVPGRIQSARLTPDGGGVVYSHYGANYPALTYARLGSDSAVVLGSPQSYELWPSVSPDGRWITYVSRESNTSARVFVRPFPEWTASRVPVSLAPLAYKSYWSRNRDELYYLRLPDLMLVAVSFRTDSGFEVTSRTPLFKLDASMSVGLDMDATGERFLVAKQAQSTTGEAGGLYMVINWADEVRRRLKGRD